MFPISKVIIGTSCNCYYKDGTCNKGNTDTLTSNVGCSFVLWEKKTNTNHY